MSTNIYGTSSNNGILKTLSPYKITATSDSTPYVITPNILPMPKNTFISTVLDHNSKAVHYDPRSQEEKHQNDVENSE